MPKERSNKPGKDSENTETSGGIPFDLYMEAPSTESFQFRQEDIDDAEAPPYLIVIRGPMVGEVFPLPNGETSIGRVGADICLRESTISRAHAKITRDETNTCWIRDLGSTNGTLVNGKQVTEVALEDGDRIQLGKKIVVKLDFLGSLEGKFHSKLFEAVTRDALTGAYNRRYLEQHLHYEFQLACRHKKAVSILIMDIDHFKQINDTHGHVAGDTVLRELTTKLGQRLRTEDVLARYGGEEFVLVLPRTSREGAITVAESLLKIVQESPVVYGAVSMSITVSIGVASLTHPPTYRNSLELMEAADRALYRAKRLGRNRVEYAEQATSPNG